MHTYVCTCTVSIPIGFSNELQLSHLIHIGARDSVSIPIGFSNELQRQTGNYVLLDMIVSIPIGL